MSTQGRPYLRVLLSSVLAVLTVCSLPGTGSATIVGSMSAKFDDTLRGGGVVAQGASFSGRLDLVANASAAITIAGIPAGSTVQRALLYWAISGGTDTTATINATAVTGASIGTAGSTCWGPSSNTNFRADVTAHVTGNGTYTIAGLPSSTATASPDTDGVALVVVYQNLSSGTRRRVMIRDGAISADGAGDVVSDTFTSLSVPFTAPGAFHIVVGDGQSFAEGPLTFGGATLGVDQFAGSDGPLWDVRSYAVSLPSGTTTRTWTQSTTSDCLLFETAVLDYTVGVCGDNLITGGEGCDHGNTINGDGCSSVCLVEFGWSCTGTPSVCTATCGDGLKASIEGCDDGDTTGGDGCSATCAVEAGWTCTGTAPSVCSTTCGDGVVAGTEGCDDGGLLGSDGCSPTCTVETGWLCIGSPSACSPVCGDGIIVPGEGCDDGDTDDGDGCAQVCQTEPGWSCLGAPSVCNTICGDTIVAGTEECDDGNVLPEDGCSDTCTLEPCVAAPLPVCLEVERAQLQSNEKTAGKEKLKLKWQKITAQTMKLDFGDPVTGTTRVALCVYDDADVLVGSFVVDRAGELCGTVNCWKSKGAKGWGYKDKAKSAEGIGKIGYGSGAATKGKADASGANNAAKSQLSLPTGLAAALAGNVSPTIQMVTDDGLCVGATMNDVQKDSGTQYKARKQ